MVSLDEAYGLVPEAEEDGVWVDFRSGIQLRIRSEQSRRAREWAERRVRAQRNQVIAGRGVIPLELQDKNDVDILAEVLVTDWRHLNGDGTYVQHAIFVREGEPLAYNADNVRQIMTRYPALRRDALIAARVDETFRQAEVAAMGKTSATPSEPPSSSGPGPNT